MIGPELYTSNTGVHTIPIMTCSTYAQWVQPVLQKRILINQTLPAHDEFYGPKHILKLHTVMHGTTTTLCKGGNLRISASKDHPRIDKTSQQGIEHGFSIIARPPYCSESAGMV